MIIRSATAGYIDAIVISKSKSSTKISPLAIKASVGQFLNSNYKE